MAEFQEVMRQWGRYCKGYTESHNDDCDGCPFEIDGSCNSYAKDNAQYAEQIEKHIMLWAAEHPESVYPMWCEWLAYKGMVDVVRMPVDYSGGIITEIKPSGKMYEHIPADIAEKLGIEPKGG